MKKVALITALLGLTLTLGACGNSSDSSSKDSSVKTEKATAHKTTDKEKGKKSSSEKSSKEEAKKLELSYNEFTIKDEKAFTTNWSDASWAGVNVKIDNVTVYKIEPYKDDDGKEINGIIAVHFNIDNTQRDIDYYPSQATLITNDGQQTGATDYKPDEFDGQIAKGVKREGTVYFEIPNLDSVSSLKNIRLQWDGDYETDDYEDENADKTYDITINLN